MDKIERQRFDNFFDIKDITNLIEVGELISIVIQPIGKGEEYARINRTQNKNK